MLINSFAIKTMITGSIYIIRNTVNDKVYIGQTTGPVKERFKNHLKPSTIKAKSNYKLYNAMNKYGSDKFYCETLEDSVPLEQLNDKEIEYIKMYDSYRNGYNATKGGDGRLINALENEEDVLLLAKSGVSTIDIAARYNVHHATVLRTLHKLGFYYRKRDVEFIVTQAKAGVSNDELSKLLGCSAATISRILKRANARRRRLPLDKREDFDFEQLICDWKNKIPIEKLCEIYDVSKSALRRFFKKQKELMSVETIPRGSTAEDGLLPEACCSPAC